MTLFAVGFSCGLVSGLVLAFVIGASGGHSLSKAAKSHDCEICGQRMSVATLRRLGREVRLCLPCICDDPEAMTILRVKGSE